MSDDENPWLSVVDDDPDGSSASSPGGVETEGWTDTIEEVEVIEEEGGETDRADNIDFALDDRSFEAVLEAAQCNSMSPEELVQTALKKYLREGGWL